MVCSLTRLRALEGSAASAGMRSRQDGSGRGAGCCAMAGAAANPQTRARAIGPLFMGGSGGAAAGGGAGCGAEGGEERARDRFLRVAVFGMPLHADDEACIGRAYRLDLAIGRRRL